MRHPDTRPIFEIIRRLNSEHEIIHWINLLTRGIKELLRVDLVRAFLFDREKCELYSLISLDNQKISFDVRLGNAGPPP